MSGGGAGTVEGLSVSLLLHFPGFFPIMNAVPPLHQLTATRERAQEATVIGAMLGILAIVVFGRWLLIGGEDGTVRKR